MQVKLSQVMAAAQKAIKDHPDVRSPYEWTSGDAECFEDFLSRLERESSTGMS
jgi:hypothetical protein